LGACDPGAEVASFRQSQATTSASAATFAATIGAGGRMHNPSFCEKKKRGNP